MPSIYNWGRGEQAGKMARNSQVGSGQVPDGDPPCRGQVAQSPVHPGLEHF